MSVSCQGWESLDSVRRPLVDLVMSLLTKRTTRESSNGRWRDLTEFFFGGRSVAKKKKAAAKPAKKAAKKKKK